MNIFLRHYCISAVTFVKLRKVTSVCLALKSITCLDFRSRLRPCGAMVARKIPVLEVACSIHVRVIPPLSVVRKNKRFFFACATS